MQNVREKREEKEKLEKIQVELKGKIGEINMKKIEVNKKIEDIW